MLGRGLLAFSLLLAVGGCDEQSEPQPGVDDDGASDDGPAEPSEQPRVAYWSDVKPIVDARCGGCHRDGGIGPFALTTYQQVASLAPAMHVSINERTMPPWPVDPTCRSYEHDASMSDAEIETFNTWFQDGTPEGDPALVGEALPSNEIVLPRADVHVTMAEPHRPVPPEGEWDEHYCFVLDWPETETKFITGFETFPGNRQVLHHFIGLIIPPGSAEGLVARDAETPEYGFPCGAGEGMPSAGDEGPEPTDDDGGGVTPVGSGSQLFAAWVPGFPPVILPDGTGMRIEPGSKILLNMHYNLVAGDTGADQTAFDFMVEDRVDKEGFTTFVTDPKWILLDDMQIPAGEPSVVHSAVLDPSIFLSGPATIYYAGMHMHELGHRTRLAVQKAGGGDECLVDIPAWDFDWQINYRLADPVRVEAGDQLFIECDFDNSAENQPFQGGEPRTPTDVSWGEDTFDEMCLGLLYATPD